jgi:flagellar protein FliS
MSTGTIHHGAESYRRTAVQASTPLELVVMLYDGALRFTSIARDAIVRRDIPARREATSRALAIVGELQSTLDLERGGEIAASLDDLYSFVSTRLLDAAVKQDVKPLDDVTRVLSTLREGWIGAASGSGAETSAPPGAR